MDSDMQNSVKQQQPAQRIQIYPPTTPGVSPFWIAKYERDAKKYWDQFYRRHQDKFFKDRHYLDKEWDRYFSGSGRKVILEVGCGAGNAVFPLIATYPDVFVYACDFSQRAVNLVKAHKDFNETRVSAFACDLTADDLREHISPASVDVVTMIFVLSAVSPEKMPLVLQNVKKVLKPNGHVLFRDYAVGDLAQERFSTKDQQISENFYVRGDGTRAYYFSNEFLTSLFKEQGLDAEELDLCCKQVENRARELVMNRRWVQAVFRFSDSVNYAPSSEAPTKSDLCCQVMSQPKADAELISDFVVDMSEGMAGEMFGVPTTNANEILGGSFVWFESLCDGNPDIQKCCNTLKVIRCNMPGDVLKTFIPSVGRPHSKMFNVIPSMGLVGQPPSLSERWAALFEDVRCNIPGIGFEGGLNPECRILMLCGRGPHSCVLI